MNPLHCTLLPAALLFSVSALATEARPGPAPDSDIRWVGMPGFSIASTETTIGQFRRYAQATGLRTRAERQGGGQVYEAGWTTRPGWTWRQPFGPGHAPHEDEPAVHIDFHEAQAYCRWAGGRLPRDAEWLAAAYTESRPRPPAPFSPGQRYEFPSGSSPAGAQCLDDCGPQAAARAVKPGVRLWRGPGHALAGSSPAGVNGLFEMGGNAWEWVDEPVGAGERDERRTRGGSWWYGSAQMRANHLQSKPADTAVVYIGFRCARD